jgi:Cu+-exporting ATPase
MGEIMKKLKFGVKGMSCAACVAHVEAAAAKLCGSENVSVSLLTNSITVTVSDETDNEKIFLSLKKALKNAGYTLVIEQDKRADIEKQEQKRSLIKLIVSLALTVILMYVAMGPMLSLPIPQFITNNPIVYAVVQLICAYR